MRDLAHPSRPWFRLQFSILMEPSSPDAQRHTQARCECRVRGCPPDLRRGAGVLSPLSLSSCLIGVRAAESCPRRSPRLRRLAWTHDIRTARIRASPRGPHVDHSHSRVARLCAEAGPDSGQVARRGCEREAELSDSQVKHRIRVGIIGASPDAGWAAQAHLPALATLPAYQLTAVATTRQASADEAARRFGAAHAFDRANALIEHPDVDLVVVSVRAPEHAPLVRAALAARRGPPAPPRRHHRRRVRHRPAQAVAAAVRRCEHDRLNMSSGT